MNSCYDRSILERKEHPPEQDITRSKPRDRKRFLLRPNPYNTALFPEHTPMQLDKVKPGSDVPNDINVIVEIPRCGSPIKYEVDKETGAMFVDRFMSTAMQYPCNYGYVPQTLSDDGDPVDVLVITPIPLHVGTVVRCRPLGMLEMEDEAGLDAKILAVPIDKLTKLYTPRKDYRDIDSELLARISHFFEHYKDLENNKWVKIKGWVGLEEAKKEIHDSIERYNA